ncbi:hypothetical protein KC19_12G128700 [Ceratodon purpureus]|uniref:Uncharacterized protein n=1 Tax=Ceratodon purpureus TaxID=3225 RepID=A0A8T0GA92_CERPU|nr:hypothetical protein KC19_12G128700 [Ceratodon purpureus]
MSSRAPVRLPKHNPTRTIEPQIGQLVWSSSCKECGTHTPDTGSHLQASRCCLLHSLRKDKSQAQEAVWTFLHPWLPSTILTCRQTLCPLS